MSAKALADSVLFQVQDTGRGIPSDKVETIFGRFQQVDASDSRQKGGTGLGLAICRSIVQQHGGRIWAQSVLGKGSIFYFTCQTVEALHRFISIEVGKTTQSVQKKQIQKHQMLPLNRPPLDPYPLSPYVAWAGKRNRDTLLEMFKQRLPKNEGHVLEFASGSGMHINYFAPHFQHLSFQPSDMNSLVFENIRQLTQETETKNVQPPIHLDLKEPQTWSVLNGKEFDAIFCINLFQVAPIAIADGMMECTANLLKNSGLLFIYGPFKVDGRYITPSNEEFDRKSEGASP